MRLNRAINQKAKREGAQSLTTEERIVLAVEALEREVNNGGYDQFFVNSSREFAPLIVGALQRIGCKKTTNITQKAIEALAISDLGSDAIEAVICTRDEKRAAKLTRCDDSYYESREPIAERLFAFIKANRASMILLNCCKIAITLMCRVECPNATPTQTLTVTARYRDDA